MFGADRNGAFPLMPGESASSFVLRLANFLTIKPDGFLREALGDARNLACAIHRLDRVEFLSDSSGLDPEVLAHAFARRADGAPNERDVLEFRVAEHHLDQTRRRVSPVALARCLDTSLPPYHHILWSLKDLNRDPATGSPLISACDHCGRALSWDNCVDPASCGRCGRPLWRAEVSANPMTQFDAFVCELFHPDPAIRRERRSKLAAPLGDWTEGDLLDLIQTLQRLRRAHPDMPHDAKPFDPEVIEAMSSIKEVMHLPMKLAARASTGTAVTVAAARTTTTIRAAPPHVAEFLKNLLTSRS